MRASSFHPVELLYRPAAILRMRPRTRGNYTHRCNIVYAEAHGVGLVMDVFQPLGKPSGQAVLDVISSGWHSDRVVLNEHIGLGLIDALCERGVTVFAVSPGSLALFTGPDMVRHVHAAIRHIKNDAGAYNILPESIGLLGVSAGGHLAALAALAPRKGRPSAHDPLRRWNTDIAAAAVFFPPTDLIDYGGMRFDRFRIEEIELASLLFHGGTVGKTEDEIVQRLTELSPARMPLQTPPPFMIIQGKTDPIVPWRQAEKLALSLRHSGGEVNLLYNETGGHLWPEIAREVDAAAAWLAGTLPSGDR